MAFFQDCDFEISNIINGHCFGIVYDIIYTGNGSIPQFIDNSTTIDKLVKLLIEWYCKKDGKIDYFLFIFLFNIFILEAQLVYCLECSYDKNNFSFNNLQGRSLAVAETLKRLYDLDIIDLELAILTKREGGITQQDYDGNFEMEDVNEVAYTIDLTTNVFDQISNDELVFEDSQITPSDFFDDFDADDESK